jgi:hypothetical protein
MPNAPRTRLANPLCSLFSLSGSSAELVGDAFEGFEYGVEIVRQRQVLPDRIAERPDGRPVSRDPPVTPALGVGPQRASWLGQPARVLGSRPQQDPRKPMRHSHWPASARSVLGTGGNVRASSLCERSRGYAAVPGGSSAHAQRRCRSGAAWSERGPYQQSGRLRVEHLTIKGRVCIECLGKMPDGSRCNRVSLVAVQGLFKPGCLPIRELKRYLRCDNCGELGHVDLSIVWADR